MKQHDLITALRARGRSDALAQAAADEIERFQGLAVPAPTTAPEPMSSAEASIFDADGKLKPDQKFDARLSVAVGKAVNSALDGFIITEKAHPVVLMGDEAEALAQITNKARASIAASRAAAKKAP